MYVSTCCSTTMRARELVRRTSTMIENAMSTTDANISNARNREKRRCGFAMCSEFMEVRSVRLTSPKEKGNLGFSQHKSEHPPPCGEGCRASPFPSNNVLRYLTLSSLSHIASTIVIRGRARITTIRVVLMCKRLRIFIHILKRAGVVRPLGLL
jgi:hypothetical protein